MILTSCAGLVTSPPADAAEPARLLAGFPRAHLTLETGGIVCLGLETYVAVTPEQRMQGLMYIRNLDEFEGMYFDYPEPATIVMWMQNTYIPLDMIFIRSDGRIAGIEADTTPLSTERIRSPEDITAVLEVNAGFAGRWRVRREPACWQSKCSPGRPCRARAERSLPDHIQKVIDPGCD